MSLRLRNHTAHNFSFFLRIDNACSFRSSAQRPSDSQRENHIHWDHKGAESEHWYADVRPGEVVRSNGQADANIAHAAADRQYLAVSNIRSAQQPTDNPRSDNQYDDGPDSIRAH